MSMRTRWETLKRSRWARVLVKIALVLVALRVLLALATPLAVELAARSAGLELDYASSRLSLHRGEFELRDLRVRPRAGASTRQLAHLGRLSVDLDLRSLLRGEPRLAQAEIDGLEVWLEFAEDGRCNWSGLAGDAPREPEPERAPQPLQLSLPLDFNAQLLRARLHVRDASVTPRLELVLEADARLEAREGRGTAVLWLSSREALRQARLQLDFEASERSLDAQLAAEFAGLDLRAAQGRLTRMGLEALGAPLEGSARARTHVELVDPLRPLLSVHFTLQELLLRSAEQRVFELETLEVVGRELGPERVELSALKLAGPAVRLDRLADGRVAFAGLAAVAALPSDAPPPPPSESAPFAFALERFALAGGRVTLHSPGEASEQPLEVRDVRAFLEDLRWPPAPGQAPLRFELHATAPDIAGAAALSGQARFSDTGVELKARAELDEATFARLTPQLAELGLEPRLRAGRARAELTAQLEWGSPRRLDAALERVQWSDERELFALERLAVVGLQGAERRLALERLELAGLRTSARRDTNGVLHALGFALRAPTAVEEKVGSTPPAGAAPPFDALQLESLSAQLGSFRFTDEYLSEPATLTLRDGGIELSQLDLGAVTTPREGAFRAWLASDELADDLRLEGRIAASRERVELAGNFSASGVDLRPLAGYLAAAGAEPSLSSGAARAAFEFVAQPADSHWNASARVSGVELSEGSERLASVEQIALDGLALRPASLGIQFASARVERPFARIQRDAQRRLSSCGLRFAAPDSATSPADPPEAPSNAPQAWFPLALFGERVDLREAQLSWRDDALATPVALELRATGYVTPLALGGDGTPMDGRVVLSVDGVCDDALVLLGGRAARERVSLGVRAVAKGLRAGPLEAYLPAGARFAHEGGSAHLKLELEAAREADGSLLATVELGPTYLLAHAGHRTLELEQLRARARIKPAPDARIELSELRTRGLRAIVERDSEGGLTVAGVRFAPPEDGGQPDAAPAANASAPAAARATSSRAPHIEVGEVELDLEALSLRGFTGEPLTLALRVEHRGPRLWLAPELDAAQPIEFVVRGALTPICGAFELALNATPFAAQPQLSLHGALRELRGGELGALFPQLADRLDGSALENGELQWKLAAHADLRRRAPLELDRSAAIGFDAALTEVEFRAQPQGEVLAGLRALRIEGGALDLRQRTARIASVELETPRLRATRDAHALSALGVRWSTANAAAEPEEEQQARSDDTGASPPAEREPEGASEAPARASFDVLVERVVATGLDFELVDTSGPLPARLPLEQLDAELKRFSLAGLARGEPLSWRATLGAAQVELPPRIVADSLLEGLADGVVDLLDGEEGARAAENRPLFAELNLSGKLALAPSPSGWAALNVEALELPALRGPALASGFEIGDGLLDLDLRLRLAGDAGMSVDSRASFAHLSLSEPADGPLARYLALPAPLDTVLFLLKDAEGRHKLSAGFRVAPEGMSGSSLAASAAGAVAGVIARAVASSPLRLLSTLTDAAGVTGGDAPPPDEASSLAFAAGDATLPRDATAVLERLAERLKGRPRKGLVLEHELSRADLERAARLASPSLADCARLTERLREQRSELSRERDELAAHARAEFAVADGARRTELASQLRAFELRIAQRDEALERVLELSRPGAERRAASRARAAAISLGAERVERARRALQALGVEPARILARVVKAQPSGSTPGGGRLRLWVR